MTETQASQHWAPPLGPLGELTAASEVRAAASERDRSRLAEAAGAAPRRPPLSAALRAPSVGVIAEVKRRSPSKGVLNAGIDAVERARAYATGGAAALSVLTEPARFGGDLGDLRSARDAVAIPLIRKDFITAEIQLLEARAHGASAVLLIARALPPAKLRELAAAAAGHGLESLVEVRSEEELATALTVPLALVGVNNRDLETLVVDDAVTRRLIPLIPRGRIAVYESGVQHREDVLRAASLGADAVLVGSSLSLSLDPRAAVTALAGVPRQSRG